MEIAIKDPLYLIIYNGTLLGYTWYEEAVLAFLSCMPGSTYKAVDATKLGNKVRSKEHFENLVKFYRLKQGRKNVSYKYIEFNKDVVSYVHVAYEFHEKFERNYQNILVNRLNKELDDLLIQKLS